MPIRYLMMGVFGFVIAAILSIAVLQGFVGTPGGQTVTPPDPVSVTPQDAANETK